MTALSGSQYKPPALPEVVDLFKGFAFTADLKNQGIIHQKIPLWAGVQYNIDRKGK